jgi:cleavage and polyadenylation specificity factor subunit 3
VLTFYLNGMTIAIQYAKQILSSPDEVTGMDGRVRPLRCSVEYISFSAHVDFVEVSCYDIIMH